MWCWRRFLRVPWIARRSNQSILKEISPGCSLEGLMLKLKFQYFGHLMRRVDSLGKTLMLGWIGGRRRRGQQKMRWLNGITDSMGMSLSKLRELVIDRETWYAPIHGVTKSRTRLSNWIELNWIQCWVYIYLQFLYLLNWSLDHYAVSFFVFCNSLDFKAYIGWYKCTIMSLFQFPFAQNTYFHPLTFILSVFGSELIIL